MFNAFKHQIILKSEIPDNFYFSGTILRVGHFVMIFGGTYNLGNVDSESDWPCSSIPSNLTETVPSMVIWNIKRQVWLKGPYIPTTTNCIVLDSTNKTAIIKFRWFFGEVWEFHEKIRQIERLRGYQWVLVTCWASTNSHWYPVAFRFDKFFHGFHNKNECPFHFPDFFQIPYNGIGHGFFDILKKFWSLLLVGI